MSSGGEKRETRGLQRENEREKTEERELHRRRVGSRRDDWSPLLRLSVRSEKLRSLFLRLSFASVFILHVGEWDIEFHLFAVTFFADLGGLYVFSFAIFFYILMQKLRNEDCVLQSIRNKTKAKKNWDKLRKYVTYTWGCKFLEDANETNGVDALCGCIGSKSSATGSQHKNGSQHKRKQTIQMDTISLNRKGSLPTVVRREDPSTEMSEMLVASNQSRAIQPRVSYSIESSLPPSTEYKTSGTDISDIQKNLQNLYEYNVLLREVHRFPNKD